MILDEIKRLITRVENHAKAEPLNASISYRNSNMYTALDSMSAALCSANGADIV